MITYNRYINQVDHVWYDSTNVIYSKCYDTQPGRTKTLKIVFKGGRTYLYKSVDADDYISFKTANSNGESFNKFIKKYDSVRIADTDIDKLNEYRQELIEDDNTNDEVKVGELVYNIKVCEDTGEFVITMGDRKLFRGIEGQFSILNLLTSLNIRHIIQRVDELPNDSDEEIDKIVIEDKSENKNEKG